MSKITISTYELFEMFPDQETARVYLESRLWPNGPRCPVCGLGERITVRKDGYLPLQRVPKRTSRFAPEPSSSVATCRCINGFTRCICL